MLWIFGPRLLRLEVYFCCLSTVSLNPSSWRLACERFNKRLQSGLIKRPTQISSRLGRCGVSTHRKAWKRKLLEPVAGRRDLGKAAGRASYHTTDIAWHGHLQTDRWRVGSVVDMRLNPQQGRCIGGGAMGQRVYWIEVLPCGNGEQSISGL